MLPCANTTRVKLSWSLRQLLQKMRINARDIKTSSMYVCRWLNLTESMRSTDDFITYKIKTVIRLEINYAIMNSTIKIWSVALNFIILYADIKRAFKRKNKTKPPFLISEQFILELNMN